MQSLQPLLVILPTERFLAVSVEPSASIRQLEHIVRHSVFVFNFANKTYFIKELKMFN